MDSYKSPDPLPCLFEFFLIHLRKFRFKTFFIFSYPLFCVYLQNLLWFLEYKILSTLLFIFFVLFLLPPVLFLSTLRTIGYRRWCDFIRGISISLSLDLTVTTVVFLLLVKLNSSQSIIVYSLHDIHTTNFLNFYISYNVGVYGLLYNSDWV